MVDQVVSVLLKKNAAIVEGKLTGKATWGRKRAGWKRLWTVERINLGQIRMEIENK